MVRKKSPSPTHSIINTDDFPQDIMLYSSSNHASKKPLLSVYWLTPDGRKINMANYSVIQQDVHRISQDEKLGRILSEQTHDRFVRRSRQRK